MTDNNHIEKTIEQQDDFIQSLSVLDIKKDLIGEPVLRSKNAKSVDNEYLKSDFEIQKLTINELKELSSLEKSSFSMKYKIAKTGLDENTILLIETNKYRATLAELMSYCKGLNISYRQFLPELFSLEKV